LLPSTAVLSTASIALIRKHCHLKVYGAVCAVGRPPPDDIPETVSMRIDRPFGFAIRGDYNQLLFMGVVKDMKKNQL